MGQISLQVPQSGQSFATEGVKVANDMTTLQTVINGNLDATNVSNALAQSAAVNTGTQTVKGAVSIATSESRTNVAYGTLTTPDQVTGIVLPANGLIAVWYQATWQESVSSAARAAIFIGANQLQTAVAGASPVTESAMTDSGATANTNRPLFTIPCGLATTATSTGYTGDVTTGQATGVALDPIGDKLVFELTASRHAGFGVGAICYVFAAAGTYTISVQFKASSGSVTASNRKLWVQALSFA